MTTQTDNEIDLTEEMISTRAHQRYIERGAEDGHDVEDWLTAEEELRTSVVTRPAETTSDGTTCDTREPFSRRRPGRRWPT